MGKRIICLLLLFLIFSCKVCAFDELNKIIDEELNSINTGEFDILEFKNSFIKEGKLPKINEVVKKIIDIILKEASNSIKKLSLLIIPLLFMGIISNLSLTGEGTVKMAQTVCFLVIASVIINIFSSALSLIENAISEVNIISSCMLPVMYSLLLSTGRVTSYTVMHPTIIFLTRFIISIIDNLLIPAILSGFMLSLTDSVGGRFGFKKISSLLIKITKWTLIFLISLFTAILSAQNILTHSFDTVALKGSKFIVANFIPVVGGAIADGAQSVGSSLILIKNATGIAGLIGILFIIFLPAIRIFLMGLSFYVLSGICQLISLDRVSEILDHSGSTVNMLGATLIGTAFLFVISIAVMLGG